MRLTTLFAIVLLSATPSTASPAEIVPVNVGGVSVNIPVPDGYVDGTGNPVLFQFAELLTPKDRRLLAVLVTKGDLTAVVSGREPNFLNPYIVSTRPAEEGKTISRESFSSTRAKLRAKHKSMIAEASAGSTKLDELARQLTANRERAVTAKAENVVSLGIIEESETSITIGVTGQVAVRDGPDEVSRDFGVGAITICIPNGKPVWLHARDNGRTGTDISVAFDRARKWINSVNAANK